MESEVKTVVIIAWNGQGILGAGIVLILNLHIGYTGAFNVRTFTYDWKVCYTSSKSLLKEEEKRGKI